MTARAIDRARWFSELSTALDDGERVLSQLIAEGVSPGVTEGLRLRLIELRAELDRINRVSLTGGRVVGSTWPASQMVHPARGILPDWRPRRD